MNSAETLTFWDHAAELRQVALKSFLAIVCGILFALYFYQELLFLFTLPLQSNYFSDTGLERQTVQMERIVNTGRLAYVYEVPRNVHVINISGNSLQVSPSSYKIPPGDYVEVKTTNRVAQKLVFLGPLDGIMASLKICFWVGFVATSPIWLFFLLQFIAPALYRHEYLILLPFLGFSFLFLTVGVLFAFFITIPAANHYLMSFNQGIATNLWTFSNYLDYSLSLMLSTAFAFEACLLLLFLVHFGILSAETMINKRRHMIVAAFILGAILTPPDVLTQLLLAIPLIVLYELAILYARTRTSRFLEK
ncbi:MAG: twin-arginine translocase subunit TatC [Parachlamydiaceae bacterium]|nr:twin-arginine translocase subunit TatC [Parachlamydiaceae bacterium]